MSKHCGKCGLEYDCRSGYPLNEHKGDNWPEIARILSDSGSATKPHDIVGVNGLWSSGLLSIYEHLSVPVLYVYSVTLTPQFGVIELYDLKL